MWCVSAYLLWCTRDYLSSFSKTVGELPLLFIDLHLLRDLLHVRQEVHRSDMILSWSEGLDTQSSIPARLGDKQRWTQVEPGPPLCGTLARECQGEKPAATLLPLYAKCTHETSFASRDHWSQWGFWPSRPPPFSLSFPISQSLVHAHIYMRTLVYAHAHTHIHTHTHTCVCSHCMST